MRIQIFKSVLLAFVHVMTHFDISVTQAQVACPLNGKFFEESGKCFSLVNVPMTQIEAYDFCKTNGGIIPKIKSLKDVVFVLNSLSPQINVIWIGNTKENDESSLIESFR